jgi:hypothetical protein
MGQVSGDGGIDQQQAAAPAVEAIGQGLQRLVLYAHPDDMLAIRALAQELQRKRAKPVAKRARYCNIDKSG